MSKYCFVEDGVITDGPKNLPQSWENISGLNLLNDPELRELGWLPYINEIPNYDEETYNPIIQYLTHESVVGYSEVTETYTINDYTREELCNTFLTEINTKMTDLYTQVKSFINTQPNGFPRYDTDLKLNVMNATMTAVALGGEKPANCTLVETWIYAVQTEFFTLKSSLNALLVTIQGVLEDSEIEFDALTVKDSLNNINVSNNYFESKYGREGTTLVDPAISTDDLFE
jgi:hypothetical protein